MNARFGSMLLLLVVSVIPAIAALNPSEIDQAVLKSGVFPDGTKVAATIQGVEVLLSTAARSATDDDLKIQTVLLARKIFEMDPSLLRVTAHYYGANPSSYKKVSISTLDVKAYNAGLADQNELLKTIAVSSENDIRFTEKKIAPDSKSLDPLSGSGAGGSNESKTDMAPERTKDSKDAKETQKKGAYEKVTAYGMTLFYPSDWELEYPKKDRGDHAVYKLKSSHNEYVELKYYAGAVSAQAVLDSSYSTHRRTDADHQRVNLPPTLKFGVGNALKGCQVGFYHTKEDKADGNQKIYERQLSFGWPKRVYKLKCRAGVQQAGNFSALFEKLLSSISVDGVPATSGKTGAAPKSSPLKKSSSSDVHRY